MDSDHLKHCALLGISESCSNEELTRAYRDLVKVWHPDRFAHDPRLQVKAQEQLKLFNAAYEAVRQARDDVRRGRSGPSHHTHDSAKADARWETESSQDSPRRVCGSCWRRMSPDEQVCRDCGWSEAGDHKDVRDDAARASPPNQHWAQRFGNTLWALPIAMALNFLWQYPSAPLELFHDMTSLIPSQVNKVISGVSRLGLREETTRRGAEADAKRGAESLRKRNLAYRWVVQAQAVCSDQRRCWIKSIEPKGRESDGSARFLIQYEGRWGRDLTGVSSGHAFVSCGFGRQAAYKTTSLIAVCN